MADNADRPNQLSGAEAMVSLLRAHGVDTVFGLCGDTSLPFYDALYRTGQDIRHVLTRDERSAAYMADGYARVTGKVGVCEGPSGGGATYILPGVVEANESSIPVLAITTDISTTGRGHFTLTELDQQALFKPLTKFNATAHSAAMLPGQMREAFRQMTTGRPGAAHICLPLDVQSQPVEAREVWGDAALGAFPARRQAPHPLAIEEAAAMLKGSEFPVFICGGGVVIAGAEEALALVAEAVDAPVATTVSGQGSIGDDHMLAVGVVGSNGGTMPTRGLLDQADCVVFVGCRAGSVTTERWRYPDPSRTRIIHIDCDPATIGANYDTDVAVVGDGRLALEALAAVVKGSARQRGAAELVAEMKEDKFTSFASLAVSDDKPIRPERLVATLNRLMDPDATLVCDPGTPCPYFSAFYQTPLTGRRFISNRAHGALGYALSAAVGAHIGRPEVKTVAVMGDGSFGFTCGELETVTRLGLPITFVVVSNSSFGWIKAGQRHSFGQRFYSVDFTRTDHAAVASAFGLKSWKVEEPSQLENALREALAHDGPTLVDVICQPLDEAEAPVSEWIA